MIDKPTNDPAEDWTPQELAEMTDDQAAEGQPNTAAEPTEGPAAPEDQAEPPPCKLLVPEVVFSPFGAAGNKIQFAFVIECCGPAAEWWGQGEGRALDLEQSIEAAIHATAAVKAFHAADRRMLDLFAEQRRCAGRIHDIAAELDRGVCDLPRLEALAEDDRAVKSKKDVVLRAVRGAQVPRNEAARQVHIQAHKIATMMTLEAVGKVRGEMIDPTRLVAGRFDAMVEAAVYASFVVQPLFAKVVADRVAAAITGGPCPPPAPPPAAPSAVFAPALYGLPAPPTAAFERQIAACVAANEGRVAS